MKKTYTIIHMSLLVIMMLAIGFLAIQVSELDNQYFSELAKKQNSPTSDGFVANKIQNLEKSVVEQSQTIKELKNQLAVLSTTNNKTTNSQYMPAPEYALNEAAFTTTEQVGNSINTIGYPNKISAWQERNELFLEHVMKKAIPFEYNRSKKAIHVLDVVANSVFHQMGLQKDDNILRVDGKPYFRGMELRHKLLEPKNKKISLLRDGKRMTINVSFSKTDPNNSILLKLTQEEFESNIDSLMTDLDTTPVFDQASNQGVKLLNINPESLFSLMRLKSQDVITEINGEPVTNDNIIQKLKTSANNVLEISYMRNELNDKVSVSLSN